MDDSGEPPENAKFSIPEFKCSQCDYKTKGPKQYELHLKAHEFKKPMFACPRCHHLFTYAGNLRTHREKHCKEIRRSRGEKNFKTSESQISQEIPKLFQTQEPCALKLDCQAPGLVPPFTFSGLETAGQSLFDLLNSSPVPLSSQKSNVLIPEKDEDGIWIQSLKKTLQQPLELFNTTPDFRAAVTVTQPSSHLDLFKNDPLPPMSKEITGLNNICIQNLMNSTSLQSLGSNLILNYVYEWIVYVFIWEKAENPNFREECLDCAFGFKDEAMYIVHRLTHLDNNPFALCGMQFFDRYSFTSHIYLQGHEEIKFQNLKTTFPL